MSVLRWGYEPEDLPWEVPLIELGLDSLMAVRISSEAAIASPEWPA
ncbi:hypothetical protein BVW01_18645 [Mycobacterium tuberculosis]|nr:hypothetical protein BVW01_18645 [Mycobacterium tuberculosis]